MNEITLKALKGSVEKWYNILHREDEDNLAENCPLCVEFRKGGCKGCPVSKKAGENFCHRTPWEEWINHQHSEHGESDIDNCYKIYCDTCRKLAQAEYDFLRDLYIEALESTPAKLDPTLVCSFCGYKPPNINCPKCHPEILKSAVGKEEWVDITGELVVSMKKLSTTAWYFRLKHLGVEIACTASHGKGKHLTLTVYEPDYKIEWESGDFRVLKKLG